MNLLPVGFYLLHVPLRGILVLPVAAGLAGGAEQQGRQFVHPLDAGRRRGRRWAQPVIPQHGPQHPRVNVRGTSPSSVTSILPVQFVSWFIWPSFQHSPSFSRFFFFFFLFFSQFSNSANTRENLEDLSFFLSLGRISRQVVGRSQVALSLFREFLEFRTVTIDSWHFSPRNLEFRPFDVDRTEFACTWWHTLHNQWIID